MEEDINTAPALRSTIEEILNEQDLIASQKLFTEIFGAISGICAVIDKNRQIVYSNSSFLEFMGLDSLEPILGKRVGEIIACVNSKNGESGCGTSPVCAYCGANTAIFESQESNLKSVKETSISSVVDGQQRSWDLKITSTPIILANHEFYLLSIQDISHEKRLAGLERIFYHDLLNIASGLNGLLSIIKTGTDPKEMQELIHRSEEISCDLIEEIMIYRQLRAAEDGDLRVKKEHVSSLKILQDAIIPVSSHSVGYNKMIMVAENSYNLVFSTDRILLQRIIINMLKNALEATVYAGIVLTGIENRGTNIRFWVRNEGVIPHDIQMQIFKRSFSTKGSDRGLGTYSVKLLAENYLRGKAGFTSNEKEGTIFFIDIPV